MLDEDAPAGGSGPDDDAFGLIAMDVSIPDILNSASLTTIHRDRPICSLL